MNYCVGIVNHEEYSLVRDLPNDDKEKTLTLKRGDKDKDRDYKKMDEMRKKLHTDDDCKLFFLIANFLIRRYQYRE